MKKLLCVCTCMILVLAVVAGISDYKPSAASQLSDWNQNGVIKELISYVNTVTDKNSANYIPEEDRIVVFDLDGTLVGEQFPIYFEWIMYAKRVLDDPTFEATPEMMDVAVEILNSGISKNIAEDMEEKEAIYFAQAFADMPVDEYREYVKEFLSQEADSFDGLCYKDAYFRPMVQILQYLEKNGFILYICSGTDRDADRVMVQEFSDIKNYHVIGTDSYLWARNHNENSYLETQFTGNDILTRHKESIIKNVKAAKTVQIYREIGQKPVLAFGNSTGDTSMFAFTTYNNKYLSAAFCIVPDDDVREYAFPKKVEKLTNLCNENGWHIISMKNDFLTMYGDNVTKNPEKLTYTEYLLDSVNDKTLNAAA